MTARDVLKRILDEIGEAQGEPLLLDETGECQLETDLGQEIVASAIDELALITVAVPIQSIHPAFREARQTEALAINNELVLTGAGRICASQSGNLLMFRSALGSENLDASTFWELASESVRIAEAISTHLERGDRVAVEDDAAAHKPQYLQV